MSNLVTDTFSKASGLEQDLKNKVANTGKHIEKISRSAGESIGEAASSFARSTSDYANSGRQYVVENPIKGLAMATATGIVVGTLFTLAMRRH